MNICIYLVTLYKFIFYFFCHTLNNTHLWPKMFLLVACMIQINQLLTTPFLCGMLAIAEHGNSGGYEAFQGHRSQSISLCPVDLHHEEIEIMQFSKAITLIYSEASQVNEPGGDPSLNCTDHSDFPWSLKLDTDPCLWCKVKQTVEAIIWTILVKRKLVTKEKLSWRGSLNYPYWISILIPFTSSCLTHHFIFLG